MKHDRSTMIASFGGAREEAVFLELLNNLPVRRCPSAATFRNTLLGDGFVAVNPLLLANDDYQKQSLDYFNTCIYTIRFLLSEGRMIDFGYVPNAVIKTESARARAAFEDGELPHPYSDGWVGLMAWEGGYNGYFVLPNGKDGAILVVEMYGTKAPDGSDIVLLYDAVSILVKPGDTRLGPFPMQNYRDLAKDSLSDKLRASNSLDPLVTMLRFLADASVPVTQFTPDAKLNRARAKSGKLPLPPHSVVHTGDYVSQIAARAAGRTQGDGTGRHASPTAHWRRSHLRHLPGDRVVKVRSSKVNWRSGEEIHRLFSKVTTAKPEEGLTS